MGFGEVFPPSLCRVTLSCVIKVKSQNVTLDSWSVVSLLCSPTFQGIWVSLYWSKTLLRISTLFERMLMRWLNANLYGIKCFHQLPKKDLDIYNTRHTRNVFYHLFQNTILFPFSHPIRTGHCDLAPYQRMQYMRYTRLCLSHKISAVVLCLSLKSQELVLFICPMACKMRQILRWSICESSFIVVQCFRVPIQYIFFMCISFICALKVWLEGRIRAELFRHVFFSKKILYLILKSLRFWNLMQVTNDFISWVWECCFSLPSSFFHLKTLDQIKEQIKFGSDVQGWVFDLIAVVWKML